jgi:hypothetical protein
MLIPWVPEDNYMLLGLRFDSSASSMSRPETIGRRLKHAGAMLGVAVALLFPAAELRASGSFVIPTTGAASCGAAGTCADPNFFYVNPVTLQSTGFYLTTLTNNLISGTSPKGWVVDTSSGAQWDAEDGDTFAFEGCQTSSSCPTLVWGVNFNVPTAQTILISGSFAANGSVSATLNGFGGFLGAGTIGAETTFSIVLAAQAGTNEQDAPYTRAVPALLSRSARC